MHKNNQTIGHKKTKTLKACCKKLHSTKSDLLFQGPTMPRPPQMDLIAELKKRQMSPLVREGKDGAIEDIITGTQQTVCFLYMCCEPLSAIIRRG